MHVKRPMLLNARISARVQNSRWEELNDYYLDNSDYLDVSEKSVFLAEACAGAFMPLARAACSSGADVNYVISSEDWEGTLSGPFASANIIAICILSRVYRRINTLDMIKFLIENNVDVKAKSWSGLSAIDLAKQYDLDGFVEVLTNRA